MAQRGLPAVEPQLAFALWELRWIHVGELPMLAAQWLADGFDGPRLRELAGITRRELGLVDEALWRDALSDAGIAADDVPVGRTAAPFLARQVLAGDLTERRLCEILWPEVHADGSPVEPQMAELIYTWDDLLDYRDRLERKRWQRRRVRSELARAQEKQRAALQHLAEGDVDRALAALGE